MQVIRIKTKKDIKRFVRLPFNLYSKRSYYIPPIIRQEIQRIDELIKNQNGEYKIAFWLLNSEQKVYGRIGAVIQKNIHAEVAKFFSFECTDDQDAADKLLNAAEQWSKQNGAQLIHGPLGFTSFDKSGILIDGFNDFPTIFSCYNHSYYQKLIENHGYNKEFDWVEYKIEVPARVPDKISRWSALIQKRHGLELISVSRISDILEYKEDMRTTINETYRDLSGFRPLGRDEFDDI
jgi:hypothetical protein